MSDDWDSEDRQTIEPEVNSWKEYLEKAKEFRIAEWTKEYNQAYKNGFDNSYNHLTKELGLFFWGRGGEQFVKHYFSYCFEIPDYKGRALRIIKDLDFDQKLTLNAQDFLDCVDCLGEQKVKELIKKLAGVEQK